MEKEPGLNYFSDEHFMKEALKLAKQAFEEDEIPIGAVVVSKNRIIGRGYNQVERLHDSTAHAEMIAITAGSEFLQSKFLTDCTLFVTVEPCLMCAGALQWSRLSRIVFGAYEPKFGYRRFEGITFGKDTTVTGGVLEDECAGLMKEFFRKKRSREN